MKLTNVRRRLALLVTMLVTTMLLVLVPPAQADEPVDVETAGAINITTAYWERAMPNLFNRAFHQPALGNWGYGRNSLYDGRTQDIRCNGHRLKVNNAYACVDANDNWVAFDVTFMNRSQNLGDAFIYVIVAHEYGHVVQAHLHPSDIWRAMELQADCFAGSAMRAMVNSGTLTLDAGDYYEIDDAFRSIAGLPWGAGGTHGSWEQRTSAFRRGWTGQNSLACLPDR